MGTSTTPNVGKRVLYNSKDVNHLVLQDWRRMEGRLLQEPSQKLLVMKG